jgi:hypothetical protein
MCDSKVCTRCKKLKPLTDFHVRKAIKDGRTSQCAECRREQKTSWARKNREHTIQYMNNWREANKDHCHNYRLKYTEENRDFVLISKRKSMKKRYRERIGDVEFKLQILSHSYIQRVVKALKSKNMDYKGSKLPYTAQQLKSHLESHFQEGMSWDNHGEWHIDHVIPVAELIRLGANDVSEINKLENLFPVWAGDNLNKRDRFVLHHSNISPKFKL